MLYNQHNAKNQRVNGWQNNFGLFGSFITATAEVFHHMILTLVTFYEASLDNASQKITRNALLLYTCLHLAHHAAYVRI